MRYGFLSLAALLAVIWAIAYLTFHIVGAFIHVVLILALVSFVLYFLVPHRR
jgi:Family of unknown function (DUF5670)